MENVTEIEILRAKLRAAAGWINNLADTLDEGHPEWSLRGSELIAAGDFSEAKSWMVDSWTEYLI